MSKNNLTRRDFLRKGTSISAASLFIPATLSASPHRKEEVQNTSLNTRDGNVNGSLESNEFFNPGTAYRGIPLWFFNDRLKKDDLIDQIKGMRQAGWGAVMPRRFSGILNPAYGKTWNDATKVVIETCKELDMKVYLPEIDKNGWYSAAPTSIPGMKDEYRNKGLIQRTAGEAPGKNEKLLTQIGEYSYYQYTSYPKEGWENSFCYLDLLDADVVNSYCKILFEFFDGEFGNEFAKTVEGIWVAEPHLMMGQPKGANCLPWTPKLPQLFEKEWGYSLLENLNLLYLDLNGYQKVRYHYWRTLSNLLATYSKITGEWCDKYKLKFTGHLMGEDSFLSQLQYSVNVMPLYEYMHIPGIDHLTMNLNWPAGDPFIMTPKQVSSVANQMGRKEVVSEMYGCCDEGLSFEDEKRVYQWLAILGVNYRCYHGAFLSMRGVRKRIYPPNMNYQQPYWDKNRGFADYGARLSYVIRQGRFQADILVIHPMESYYLQGKIKKELSKEVGPLDGELIKLSHNLLKIHRSYDYGDETILSKYGKAADKKIQVGEMDYKIVIIPSVDTLRKSTVKLLQEFIRSGGTIISTGTLPKMIDGEMNKKIETINKNAVTVNNESEAISQILDRYCPPDILVKSPENKQLESIWVHPRITENGKVYYLANTNNDTTFDAEIRINGSGRLESWNLENGRIETIPQEKDGGYVKTSLPFSPNSSYILFLNEKVPQIAVKRKADKVQWKRSVNEFQVKREDDNALTLDFCRYKKGSGEWSNLLPIQGIQEKLNNEKYYGPVSLQFEFKTDKIPQRCEIVIEEADKYKITANGTEVKYDGLPYYRDKYFLPISISHLIKIGNNTIEISREFQSAEEKVLGIEELERFYGTELEQIYVKGDFAVKGEFSGKDFFETERHRYKPGFIITEEKKTTQGDLLADGYCFFNGTMKLTADIVVPEIKANERYYLELEQLESVLSEIEVNSKKVGIIAWKPYRIDITDYVWKGENKVSISLTNSLRNLLGEIHFMPLAKYKFTSQWSEKVTPKLADGPNWMDKRGKEILTSWSDDYYFRPFGIKGGVSIISLKST